MDAESEKMASLLQNNLKRKNMYGQRFESLKV